jgi:hypothetical protein
VTVTSEQSGSRPADDFVPTEELVRHQGVRPIGSVDELAGGDPFESDEEYAEFLADLYAYRRAGIA